MTKKLRLNKGRKGCETCGASGLYWRRSKKGNWVLWESVRDEAGDVDERPHFVHCGADVENAPAPAVVTLTADQKDAIQTALRIVAGDCDGAYRRDDVGFSRYDADFGRSLAEHVGTLTDRQAAAGQKLVRKYRRQISAVRPELLDQAGVR